MLLSQSRRCGTSGERGWVAFDLPPLRILRLYMPIKSLHRNYNIPQALQSTSLFARLCIMIRARYSHRSSSYYMFPGTHKSAALAAGIFGATSGQEPAPTSRTRDKIASIREYLAMFLPAPACSVVVRDAVQGRRQPKLLSRPRLRFSNALGARIRFVRRPLINFAFIAPSPLCGPHHVLLHPAKSDGMHHEPLHFLETVLASIWSNLPLRRLT